MPQAQAPPTDRRRLAVIFKGTGFYQTDYRSKQYTADKSKAEAQPGPAPCDTKKCESCPKNSESKSQE